LDKLKITVANGLAAEQCGASWVNELVVATEMETKFEY
jgi:hypothetical protein